VICDPAARARDLRERIFESMTAEEQAEYNGEKMNGRPLDKIERFEYYEHMISGIVRTSNISAGGPAIPGSAVWYLVIDGDEITAIGDAQPDDQWGEMRTRLRRAADKYLIRQPSEL
jgi:hypothetical protein